MRCSSIFWILFLLFFTSISFLGICEDAPKSATESQATPSLDRNIPLDESLREELLREGEQGETPFWKSFFYMLFVLSFIVSLIFLLTWAMKKMVHTRLLQENAGTGIQVLDKRSLSPKSMLYVIEAEGKRILIGESPTGLVKLVEKNLSGDFSIEDEETQASMKKILENHQEK